MEIDPADDVPCSSSAVESIIRTGTAGLLWGSCSGPVDSKELGLTGRARASFVAKSIGRYGFQCGLFAGIFTFTSCGVERYRRKKDWVNALIAGGISGAAIGAGTRNWKQVYKTAGLLSVFCALLEKSRPNKNILCKGATCE